MHVIKEASTSSRIEGTQTEIDEALKPKEMVAPERRDDWQEVQNYIKGMNQAIGELERLPLSNRLLKNTHKILLEGVRGEGKFPGEFRKSQNWIGGSGPSDAAFVPPDHTEVPEVMSDLEKFLHNTTIQVPHLIRIAISHFRESNELGHWVRFLLTAVRDTAVKGKETFEAILSLRSEVEQTTLTLGKKAENARLLLNHLYRRPFVTPNEVSWMLNITHQTASSLIRNFEELNILKKWEKVGRNQGYVFGHYLALFLD